MKPLTFPTSAKLFATGFTVGPLVDSLHNQCLLKYNVLPISIPWPVEPPLGTQEYLLASSWIVPPLLGIAYVVLGGVLPRIFEGLLTHVSDAAEGGTVPLNEKSSMSLCQKAFLAVTTTSLIIKSSKFLETHSGVTQGMESWTGGSAESKILVLMLAALAQWAWLDRSLAALLAACITSIGGPLSELPFIGWGVWEYLPQAADYLPLQALPESLDSAASILLGAEHYRDLALSSITGPCYFAATMDAIALGRWCDEQPETEQQ